MIQSFAYTHELSWNVLRDYLKDQGTQQLYGSQDTIREAFTVGLIQHGDDWMDMIPDRNRSSHTYNFAVAKEIVQHIIESYIQRFHELDRIFTGIIDEETI